MFENIIGHEKIKKEFIQNIKNNNIYHSYLFEGNKGIGKATFAKEFAKIELNNQNLNSAVDFKYISKNEDKKDIIVEQVRKNLVEDVHTYPVYSNKKVYIIDDAESLNKASQNALLKTLEEPPEYVLVILITNNINNILPTILSRVIKINFLPLEEEKIKEYIEKNLEENIKLKINKNILKYVNGSIGNLINIVEKNYIEEFLKIDELVKYIKKGKIIEALKFSEELDFKNLELLDYLQTVIYLENMYNGVKVVEKTKCRLLANGNYDITIDNMIININEGK